MTDLPITPTDEELLRLYKVATPCYHVEEFRRELDFARAVLARWGNTLLNPCPNNPPHLITMTDQHPITPTRAQVTRWWAEACDQPTTVKLDYVAAQAAEWGWRQRDASVPGELQKARDEELEACCEWLDNEIGAVDSCDLRAERRGVIRPKPPSLAEEAQEAVQRMWEGSPDVGDWGLICRALGRLQELEGAQ